MYDLDCMRCKKKLTQQEAASSNHCSTCLILVTQKWKQAEILRDNIMQHCLDFESGMEKNEDIVDAINDRRIK